MWKVKIAIEDDVLADSCGKVTWFFFLLQKETKARNCKIYVTPFNYILYTYRIDFSINCLIVQLFTRLILFHHLDYILYLYARSSESLNCQHIVIVLYGCKR